MPLFKHRNTILRVTVAGHRAGGPVNACYSPVNVVMYWPVEGCALVSAHSLPGPWLMHARRLSIHYMKRLYPQVTLLTVAMALKL